MKVIAGLILLVLSVFLGLYVGVWWAFIGGIVQVITSFQQPHIDALMAALGITRVMGAGLFGAITFYGLFIPGLMMVTS